VARLRTDRAAETARICDQDVGSQTIHYNGSAARIHPYSNDVGDANAAES